MKFQLLQKQQFVNYFDKNLATNAKQQDFIFCILRSLSQKMRISISF